MSRLNFIVTGLVTLALAVPAVAQPPKDGSSPTPAAKRDPPKQGAKESSAPADARIQALEAKNKALEAQLKMLQAQNKALRDGQAGSSKGPVADKAKAPAASKGPLTG